MKWYSIIAQILPRICPKRKIIVIKLWIIYRYMYILSQCPDHNFLHAPYAIMYKVIFPFSVSFLLIKILYDYRKIIYKVNFIACCKSLTCTIPQKLLELVWFSKIAFSFSLLFSFSFSLILYFFAWMVLGGEGGGVYVPLCSRCYKTDCIV